MSDYRPTPFTKKVEVRGTKACAVLDKSIDEPNGHVCDQQERNDLTTRLCAILVMALGTTPPRVENEYGLH
jgi:hypothetical protein